MWAKAFAPLCWTISNVFCDLQFYHRWQFLFESEVPKLFYLKRKVQKLQLLHVLNAYIKMQDAVQKYFRLHHHKRF
jgi:hypothetical protein